ncbi:P-loop containing nucleoside triphosphate hydrolase protein [Aspergillus campestris IBT 28561]|uniref:P-loop containing nucleoside triphosphate hydrolase protein n=1 Tax=Aspergillus campestris (strain IBT 28561) TaxID=1392248 RepID=A0A2I1DBY1_ASPC2|nr:P-loop containing nucleoside triphosphate hydrolase protein [Aspergillus campestris IBT 28561]PKY07392.1 P-loop containing nucleoside triphosphate hydrolase protein [Aspergillus campestris IBT 28561]
MQTRPSSSSSSSPSGNEAKSPEVSTEPVQKNRWHQRLNPWRSQASPPVPTARSVSREHGASFLSIAFFHWMSPLMKVGYSRPLQLEDIWTVNPDRAVDVLSGRLEASLDKRTHSGMARPLAWALYDTFRAEFVLGGMCQLVSALLLVFTPYLTRFLIAFATEAYSARAGFGPSPPRVGDGIGLVVGITCMQALQSLCNNQFLYRGQMVGGQIRAVLVSRIFQKALKLSGRAKAGGQATPEEVEALEAAKGACRSSDETGKGRQRPNTASTATGGVAGDGHGWNNGRITALMSIDVDRINLAMGMFHVVWTAPITILVTLVLLLVNIGYSCLSGYAFLIVGMSLLSFAVRSLIQRRKKINNITDQRVSLTQEILHAVRFVKYFGWESSFLDRLEEIRGREIRSVQALLAIRNAILCVSMSIPIFGSMLAFITYALTNHDLDPALVFSSLALFNSMRMPLNLLPIVMGQVTDAWTALNRIQDFLLAEEQREDIGRDEAMESAIEMDHASFTWERLPTDAKTEQSTPDDDDTIVNAPTEPFKLQDMTFTVGRNELLAVIGTVGCGKSSLLSALAGEMRVTDGTVRLSTTRAFCPQYAWIQNTSVRNNILFGKEYNESWYEQVVDACALTPDLEMLPDGDQTEIGERGINVSGGQKQRLNISRAIYFDADLVLMDDPLSAVDAHVGRHIMDKAICGLLKDRCRVLATHQLHVLNRCDRIIIMDEGRISAIDTFDNLMQNSELFRRLMSTSGQETAHEEGDEATDEAIEESEDTQPSTKTSAPSKPAAALMQEEEKGSSSVGWGIWKAYILASGGYSSALVMLILLGLSNVASIWTSLWLSYWTANKYPTLSTGQYIGVYAGLGGGVTLLVFVFSTYMTTCNTNASKAMLQRAMSRVLRAPMSFFDTTPLGRITNRFSKDIQVMDNELSDAMRLFALTITMIIAVMVLTVSFFYYFIIALVPLVIIIVLAANYYRASAREMKRHESVLRSTVYAKFGEAITGAVCIRAYGVEKGFQRTIQDSIDVMNGAYFLTFSNQRWLSVRLDAVSTALIFVVGILVVTSRFNVTPSTSGLVLSYILAIAQMLQFTVRQLAEIENNMNATERVHYYGTELDEEAPLHQQVEASASWPEHGHIEFNNAQMRYRAGLPLVLKGLSMNIQGGERIGIIGRTGAGKSSIMSALFRLTELSEGTIKIDDINISTIGLQALRSRLTIIPQDPALFKGTVRSNLDPFNEHNDLELWSALRKAYLTGHGEDPEDEKPPNSSASGATTATTCASGTSSNGRTPPTANRLMLESPVEEEGLNFSLGQRQLMALARALVRDTRIIVCDEATSSVDFETDRKIQRTMAQGFAGRTLLCIAHRLRTIMHYDRICVMDQGRIAEMDAPVVLWDRPDGIFRAMCDRSGITREDILCCD